MTKISIIIPVYNTSKYLRQCLDTVINQTLQDIEIICINDGSTDESGAILEQYAAKDGRIRIINKENGGPGAARNAGLQIAEGKYIMFLDSDDYYTLDACRKMFDAMENNNADIVVCDLEVIYETDRHIKNADKKNHIYSFALSGRQDINASLIYKFKYSPLVNNKIYRKEIIERYKISFLQGIFFEDLAFFLEYISVSKYISFVSQQLAFYRRRAGSTMNKTLNLPSDLPLDYLKVFPYFYKHLQTYGLWDKYFDLFWKLFIDYFRLSYQRVRQKSKEKALSLASDIVSAADMSYIDKLSLKTRSLLLAVKDKKYKPFKYTVSLFGFRLFILQIEPFSKYELRIIQISIYKVKYLKDLGRQLYILGVCVKKYK